MPINNDLYDPTNPDEILNGLRDTIAMGRNGPIPIGNSPTLGVNPVNNYEPSLMNAVRGIRGIPGAMATEMDLPGKASRLWGGIKDTAKTIAMSAGGQIAAQVVSPTYVNPPGGLFYENKKSTSPSDVPTATSTIPQATRPPIAQGITPNQQTALSDVPSTITQPQPSTDNVINMTPVQNDNQTVYQYTDKQGRRGLTNIPSSIPVGSKSSVLLKSPGIGAGMGVGTSTLPADTTGVDNINKTITDEIARIRALPPAYTSDGKMYIPQHRTDVIERLLGHQVILETGRATAKERADVMREMAKERDLLARDRLAETTRYDKERADNYRLRVRELDQSREADREVKIRNAFNTELDKLSPKEGMNQTPNTNIGLFNMVYNNYPIIPEHQKQADILMSDFNKVWNYSIKLHPELKDDPNAKATVRRKYIQSLSNVTPFVQ